MELPVINRFSGLESGMSSLQNPSFLSQIFASLSGVETLSQSLDFWKWSAVIIALVATFSGVVMNRVKILFVIFQRQKRILQDLDDSDFDSDSDDEFSVDDSASSVSSSWSEFEEDDEPATSARSWDSTDRDFNVRGSDYYMNDHKTKQTLRLRHRRSFHCRDGDFDQFLLTDFERDRSVVKLWDSFNQIKDQTISSIFAGNSSAITSTVMLSAGVDLSGKLSLNLWDSRVGSEIPALVAEWNSSPEKIADIHLIDDQKVYVRDDVAGKITVGDVRNVKSPLENLTAADVETWWDADAVLVSAE